MISDAIFGKVGDNEAMILTWVVHDPFEHVSIGLFLMRDRGCSRDGILELDRQLSLLPKVCRALSGAMNVVFLFPRVDQQAGMLSVPWPTVDRVGRMMRPRASRWSAPDP